MPIEPAIAHLQAAGIGLKTVDGAAEFAAASQAPKQFPAAFLLLLSETPGADRIDLGVGIDQYVTCRFAVVMAIKSVKDAKGRSAAAALKALRTSVRDTIGGWKPYADWDPCMLGPGRLLKLQNGVLWWQDEFATGYSYYKV